MKKEIINLSYILNNECEKTHKIILSVKPLSSLSISNNPGNQGFFSLSDFDHKVRGMVENMLGIDMPKTFRTEIIKVLKKNKNIKDKYSERYNRNGWFSVLTHVIDVAILNPDVFEKAERFDDLHKRLMRRPNTGTHANGCENKTRLIKKLFKLAQENNIELKKVRFVTNEEYDKAKTKTTNIINDVIPSKKEFFTNENFGKIPYFHKGVFNRENIIPKENIIIELSVTDEFFQYFSEKFYNNLLRNDVYLGDSNSLVNIEEIKFN